jgi:hypothetical protein
MPSWASHGTGNITEGISGTGVLRLQQGIGIETFMTHFEAKGRQRKGLSGTFGESTRPPRSHSPGPEQGKLRFEEELGAIRRRGSRELMPAIDNSMSPGNPKLHSLARARHAQFSPLRGDFPSKKN